MPLRVICQKLSHIRFAPSGWFGNPKIGCAESLMDYFARWLDLKFLSGDLGLSGSVLLLALQVYFLVNLVVFGARLTHSDKAWQFPWILLYLLLPINLPGQQRRLFVFG